MIQKFLDTIANMAIDNMRKSMTGSPFLLERDVCPKCLKAKKEHKVSQKLNKKSISSVCEFHGVFKKVKLWQ